MPIVEVIAQLSDSRSPKRRSAAKKLRKLKDPLAGPALLDALRQEVTDVRTWETQYQMIMALAYCGYKKALPYLKELATHRYEATMVTFALGYSLIRLGIRSARDEKPIREILLSDNDALLEGGVLALAILEITVNEDLASEIMKRAFKRAVQSPDDDFWRLFFCAAASSWPGDQVRNFLLDCAKNCNCPVKDAAEMALKGERWNCEKNLS